MALVHEQLQNTAIKVLHSRICDVLLNTVYEIANLNDEYADTTIYGEILAYSDLSDEIHKTEELFKKLPSYLAKPLEERTEYTKEISARRDSLTDKYKCILTYAALTKRLAYKGEFRSKLEMISENTDILPHSDADLVDTVSASVARSYDIPFVISSILSKIPLRMTKAKYLDLAQRSLELMFSDIPKRFIDSFKFAFSANLDPRGLSEYGKYFPLIAQTLDELSKFDYSSAKGEVLEEQMSMIDDVGDKTDNIEEILNVCYNITNYIDILNTYSPDAEYAFYDDPIKKDMLYSCIEMLDSDTPEIYTETIIDKITSLIEALFNDMRDYEDTLQDTMHRLNDAQFRALPEDCRLSLQVYSAITSLYMLEITDGLSGISRGSSKPATIEETDSAIEDILNMLTTACDKMPVSEQKLVKQLLFTQLPADISPNEFREYMLYALEGIKDDGIRTVVYGDVLEVLDDAGLMEAGTHAQKHAHEHEHEHSHDCDCGHDHN